MKFLKVFYKKPRSKNIKRAFFFCLSFSFISLSLFARNGETFYVDASASIKASSQKGTAEYPFGSLEQAVEEAYNHINRQKASGKGKKFEPVSIFLRSNIYVEEAIFLTIPIKINGVKTPIITFGENAGFVVEKTSLEIKNCSIKRSERFTEPRTVPVLYASQGSITLNKVAVNVKEGGDAAILRDSRLQCTDISFASEQSTQAVLIRAEKSSVSILRGTFAASGLMALCFDFIKTQCTLKNITCNLSPLYTGRAAELSASTIKAQKIQCSYTSPLFEMMDTAILADNASKVEHTEAFELTGFAETLTYR